MKKPWSSPEVAILRSQYDAGRTDAEIAGLLNRSVNSVTNARQKHGITRPDESLRRPAAWTPENLQLAESLYAAGFARRDVAVAVNRTSIAVKQQIKARGWKRGGPPGHAVNLAIFNSEDERWRNIPGWSAYAVSSLGNVMSLHHGRLGELLAQWQDEDGYVHVHLSEGGLGARRSVHRLVALAFLGDAPSDDHVVAHCDGIPWNNKATNLRWATQVDNQGDRLKHGTAQRGVGGRFVPCSPIKNMVRQLRESGAQIWIHGGGVAA